MAKMTDRELTRRALCDAISWQHSLVNAHGADTVAGKAYALRASQYRELLNRRYSKVTTADVRRSMAENAAIGHKLVEDPKPGKW